jgi:acyl-[acyl carrier protein]--UDP-N-acetylglucosamine O-acyltransferase
VSYETTTYNDLKFLLATSGIPLTRIDPVAFINTAPDPSMLYVNMVTLDLALRKKVTETIDNLNLDRFNFIHESSAIWSKLSGKGLLIFPFVGIMTDVTINNDVILYGHNGIAHRTHIGTGCVIDAYTMIAGSSNIGDFCHIRSRVTVYDKVNVANDVIISANSIIRKDIVESGVYATITKDKTVKLRGRDGPENS